MELNNLQASLSRQFHTNINSICVFATGTILKKNTQNTFEVKLNKPLSINNKAINNIIYCKALNTQPIGATLKENDKVCILFSDYNENNFNSVSNIEVVKHTIDNGIIVGRYEDFTDENNKNIIIKTRDDEKLIVDLAKKMYVANGDANLQVELQQIEQQFSQLSTHINTLLTVDLMAGIADLTTGKVNFPTLQGTTTQINQCLTEIDNRLKNVLKLFTNENS